MHIDTKPVSSYESSSIPLPVDKTALQLIEKAREPFESFRTRIKLCEELQKCTPRPPHCTIRGFHFCLWEHPLETRMHFYFQCNVETFNQRISQVASNLFFFARIWRFVEERSPVQMPVIPCHPACCTSTCGICWKTQQLSTSYLHCKGKTAAAEP